ncbi:MAG TPA: proline--tRNA ligase [Candidatus Woesearchaeota archaeon]|nr:proline--tRNA ligase [Candidatus Woesearchaeota archaeon]
MADKIQTQGITIKKEENFSEWYEQVTMKCGLVDKRLEYSRGFYGYPPWGTMILRSMETLFEKELELRSHLPIRTPTAMPIALLEKEQEHLSGFAPEIWKITHGHGGKKLEYPKALRPTGEAVMYPYFHYWIENYKDLPFKVFETRPSFRAERENAIFPLLRTCEFFWIEAHTVQLDNKHADKQVKEDMEVFDLIAKGKLAMPFMLLKRPEWDKFSGADYTCAYDTPLPDGKVSQIGTTHNLGTHFSRAFDVRYTDNNNEQKFCYQTSFGPGVGKILGMLAAVHGDDNGLILPPDLAPIQFVIVPIYKEDSKEKVTAFAKKAANKLKSFRLKFDDREGYTPGWKFNEWEMKGVPFRVEIGPKDVEKNQVILVSRLDRKKTVVEIKDITDTVLQGMLSELTKEMYSKAEKKFKIDKTDNYKDIIKKIDAGTHLVEIPFCNTEKCSEKLKEKTIKVRGIQLFAHGEKTVVECEQKSAEKAKGKKCAVCGKEAKVMSFVARQY